MAKRTIYDLGLHEELIIVGYKVLKVTTGWLYFPYIESTDTHSEHGTFVPQKLV